MIEINLALLASLLIGLVEPKAGEALWEGLFKIKHALRKPLKSAFQKAVEEVIKETEQNDNQTRTALINLKSKWETLEIAKKAKLDRKQVCEVFEENNVPEEFQVKLYDKINDNFLKAFANVAKKHETSFVTHVIFSLNEMQKDSFKREKDMECLLEFCKSFGLDTVRISEELGKIQKNLSRIENDMATKAGVDKLSEKIQNLTNVLLLDPSNLPLLTREQKRLLKEAEKSEDTESSIALRTLLKAENEIIKGNYSKAKIILNKFLAAAKKVNDEIGMVNAYGFLSMMDIYESNFNEAIIKLNYVIEFMKKRGDVTNLVRAFNDLGLIYSKQGDLDKALDTYEFAQSMILEKDHYSQAVLVRNIGRMFAEKGDYQKAQQEYEKSLLLIKRAIRNKKQTDGSAGFMKQHYAGLFCDFAYLCKIRGNYQEALRLYKKSIRISTKLGDRLGVVNAKGDMAEILYIEGKFSDALKSVQEGLVIAERLENKTQMAEAKREIGRVYLQMDEFELAQKNLEDSLNFFTHANNRLQALHVSHDLATVYEHKDEISKAVKLYEENLKWVTKFKDKLGIAITKHQLGVIYERSGDLETAKCLFEDALRIAKEIGYKDQIARDLFQIAGIYSDIEQYPKALELYQESMRLAKELGNVEFISCVIEGFASLYKRQGKYSEAVEEYKQAIAILKRLNKKKSVALSLYWLGNVYRLLGNSEKALKAYDEALGFAELAKDKEGVGTLMGYIGILYYEKKDFPRALYYLRTSSFTPEVKSPNKPLFDAYLKRLLKQT